jgi:hypothetical protein
VTIEPASLHTAILGEGFAPLHETSLHGHRSSELNDPPGEFNSADITDTALAAQPAHS